MTSSNSMLYSLSIRSLTIGVVTGLRSMTPFAMLALRQSQASGNARWAQWPVLRNGIGKGVFVAAGLGELVGDKLPNTPSRLAPLPLVGRMTIGAIAGAAIGSEGKGSQPIVRGAVLGAFGGLVGSFAGYHLRHAIVEKSGLPDLVVALGEDAIAISLAAEATMQG